MGDLGEFPPGAESTRVLKLLDAAARCSICYSIFDAPLSLRGCGHSCKQTPLFLFILTNYL